MESFLKDFYSHHLIRTEVYSELYSIIRATPRCEYNVQSWSELEAFPFFKNKPKTEAMCFVWDGKVLCTNHTSTLRLGMLVCH